jgi:ubiquinone/menaquinone biosynthesis C-methylase UbiE
MALDHSAEVERLAANYSSGAEGYAECWSPVIRPVGRRLLEALPWDRASRVVDIGTGTGALIPEIRRFAPGAEVVGVDRSFGMLALAPRSPVRLTMMDAMRLGLRTAAFDVAVMAFILFHIPEPAAALAEVRRVLRPRGAVGIVTWGEDPDPPACQVWNDELDASGARDPNPQTIYSDVMNSPEKLTMLLMAGGLAPRRVWIEQIEHQWDAVRFMMFRMRFGTTRRRLEALDRARRAAVVDRIRARMMRLDPADFLYRAQAVCAVATA